MLATMSYIAAILLVMGSDGGTCTVERADEMIRVDDTDGDGHINYEEFDRDWPEDAVECLAADEAQAMYNFDDYDRDGNDVISSDEVRY